MFEGSFFFFLEIFMDPFAQKNVIFSIIFVLSVDLSFYCRVGHDSKTWKIDCHKYWFWEFLDASICQMASETYTKFIFKHFLIFFFFLSFLIFVIFEPKLFRNFQKKIKIWNYWNLRFWGNPFGDPNFEKNWSEKSQNIKKKKKFCFD